MARFAINVNGRQRTVDVLPDTPLLWVLRDSLGLTGAKYGCGIGACGSCTVLIDGAASRSCAVPVSQVGSKKIVTIEGLSRDGAHALQQAWIQEDVAQCGYCQTGQIMAAAELLAKKRNPSDADIKEAMEGNLCRCGTYERVRKAIRRAAKAGGAQ